MERPGAAGSTGIGGASGAETTDAERRPDSADPTVTAIPTAAATVRAAFRFTALVYQKSAAGPKDFPKRVQGPKARSDLLSRIGRHARGRAPFDRRWFP